MKQITHLYRIALLLAGSLAFPLAHVGAAEPVAKPRQAQIETFAARLQPVGRILNLMNQGWIVWGCAPIYDEEGNVHVFFARWKDKGVWEQSEWGNSGQIVHAVAKRPEGPYKILEVVLQGRGGDHWDATGVINPQIYKFDGKYVLLYTGVDTRNNKPLRDQAVGMAVADSLNGPWTVVSDKAPLVAPSHDKNAFDDSVCNNPALMKTPEGKFYLYYKGHCQIRGKLHRSIGVAIADKVEGPYQKFSGNPVLNFFPRDFEDPYVWYEDGRFKMLMHDLSYFEHGAGLYFESTDGLKWDGPTKGYPSAKTAFGMKQRLETPILLMKDGRPDYLFNNRGGNVQDRVFSGFVWKVANPKKTTPKSS